LQKAVGDGFQLKGQLVGHLADMSKLDKICSVFDSSAKQLKECNMGDQRLPAAMVLLQLACARYAGVLERNSECLADMESNVHWNCVEACYGQAGVDVNTPSSSSRPEVDDESVCKIGTCVAKCVGSQLQECEEEGDTLKNFYAQLAGAQMFHGMEVGQREVEGDAYALVKSKKFPAKCQELVKDAINAASSPMGEVKEPVEA